MENDLLLTAETLWLNPHLTCGKSCNGVFAVKCAATQGYLTINERQAKVLNEFVQPRTVPEVLEICIRNRICIPLVEFYDLIVKARAAGILRAELTPQATAKPPVRWMVALPPFVILPLAVTATIATIVSALLHPPWLPTSVVDLLLGWLATSLAYSFGHVLAACALRGAGCDVYQPQLRWRYWVVPHFGVDLRDACMSSIAGRASVAASVAIPLAAVVAGGVAILAHWTLVPAIVFLIECSPFWRATVGTLLRLVRRHPLLDTDEPPAFDSAPTIREELGRAWRQFDGWVAGLQALIAVGWALLIARALSSYLHVNVLRSIAQRATWANAAAAILATLVAVVVLWFATMVRRQTWAKLVGGGRTSRQVLQRWLTRRKFNPTPLEIDAFVRQNPLLRRLEPEAQDELIQKLKPFHAAAWRTLIQFDDDPPFVTLIVSGSVAVYRRGRANRRTPFLRLVEGDLFGVHRLVDRDYPSLEVKTTAPLAGLVVERDDFMRIVVNRLGASAVRHYAHRLLFLQRVSKLCADWRPNAVARFAELASKASQLAGGKIVIRGQEVIYLYILYEGIARVLREGKQVGTLDLGDVFGEISLLQSSAATADVESKDGTCCLLVNRSEFIRFMSRNYHVALQIERLCARRLGRPIFPVDEMPVEEEQEA